MATTRRFVSVRTTGNPPSGGKKPTAPTIGTATGGNGSATVAFTAPSYLGKGGTVTYRATSTPGSLTGTSTSSPITVSGLSNGTGYTFTVTAETSYGVNSDSSAASNTATPSGPYSLAQTYNSSTTYTVPSGVSKLAAYVIAGGSPGVNAATNVPGRDGGGGGGGVAFQDLSVSTGDSFTVTVGGSSGASSLVRSGVTIASVSGRSTFSSNVSGYVTATGGAGGTGGAAAGSLSNGNPGGAGGNGGTLTLNASGLTSYQVGGGGGGGGGGANYMTNTTGSRTGGTGGAGGSLAGGAGGNGGNAEKPVKFPGVGGNGNNGANGTQPGGGGGGSGGGGQGNEFSGTPGNVGNGGTGRIYIYTS